MKKKVYFTIVTFCTIVQNNNFVSAWHLVLWTSFLYRQGYIFSLSSDNCKSLWIKASAKCKCKCILWLKVRINFVLQDHTAGIINRSKRRKQVWIRGGLWVFCFKGYLVDTHTVVLVLNHQNTYKDVGRDIWIRWNLQKSVLVAKHLYVESQNTVVTRYLVISTLSQNLPT